MSSTIDERAAAAQAVPSARSAPLSLTDALLVVMSCIWGINYTVVKYGTTVLRPLAYNGVRVSLAAVALAIIAAFAPRRPVSRRDLLALLGLGVLGNGVYQFFFAEGVARTRAGTAAIVVAAAPALIALIGRALGVERVTRRRALGIALSIGGIALVVSRKDPADHDTTVLGNALVLIGSVAWAMFSVLLKRYADRVDLYTLSAATMVGGAVPLLAVSVPSILDTTWSQVSAITWSAIAYSAFVALVLAYFFWYRGVRQLGPTRTAIYSNLQPVVALGVAWIALGEMPTLWQGVGAGTIIAGVILTRT